MCARAYVKKMSGNGDSLPSGREIETDLRFYARENRLQSVSTKIYKKKQNKTNHVNKQPLKITL